MLVVHVWGTGVLQNVSSSSTDSVRWTTNAGFVLPKFAYGVLEYKAVGRRWLAQLLQKYHLLRLRTGSNSTSSRLRTPRFVDLA